MKIKTKSQDGEESILSLPEERTEPANALDDLVQVWFGPEKIGKTSFAAQFEDALFLAFEPGGKELEIYQKQVASWQEFLGYLKLLEKSKRFRTIVVDTVDLCFKMCEEYVMQKLMIKHASDEDYGKGWSLLNDEFARAMGKLMRLRRGVILISHAEDREIKSRSGVKYNRTVPTMSKQARRVLEPMADVTAYMGFDDKEKRSIFLRGNSDLAAGHRLQKHFIGVEKIPMGKNASEAYANFVDAFNNHILLGKESNGKIKIRR